MLNDSNHKVLPRKLDPRKFVQQGVNLSGLIDVASLSRVQEVVAEDGGSVQVDLAFAVDEEGKKTITGKLVATLNVLCQRCLEVMAYPVEASVSLAVVWTEEQAKALPKHLDPLIHGEGVIDMYQVLEEELLLALPMVVYHDHACVRPEMFSAGEEQEESKQESAVADNPFQVLEQLKGSPK